MEEFIHLVGSGGGGGGGGVGNSRGSFMYFPSSTTNTTSTSTNPPPGMIAPPPGYYGYCPTSLQPLKSEAGPSQYPPQREVIHVGEEISPRDMEAIKTKIMSHPQYSTLLVAFIDCQKVGAPLDVLERLTAIARRVESCPSRRHEPTSDPELDQFMEAYCNMLVKYREELSRPIQEAMDFLKRVETQLNSLTNGASARFFTSDAKCEIGSAEEDGSGEGEVPEIYPCTEEKELKHHLLKKYSGCLSSLRKELSKKKKKGNLPKEARQKLLNWWELHYKWPYPSETEKVALAELTGLDQKQINNWFINQRKRHWKPSEDMQFVVMDGFRPQNAAAGFYMEGQLMGDSMYRFAP